MSRGLASGARSFSSRRIARTSSSGAAARHSEAGGLYISVLTDPVTGGVAASFASLGDINIAEPRARIGFTGPRVIKSTINAELPDGFQLSEFLLEHGQIDMIVHRRDMRDRLAGVLDKLLGSAEQ